MMMRNDPRSRRFPNRLVRSVYFLFLLGLCNHPTMAGDPETKRAGTGKSDPAAVEFFEKDVRPILATRCQGCHGPVKQKGGLRLDARASILVGGTSGPAVVPGDPKESLLVDAINYGETYQMPPKSKLPDGEIATLTRWVQMGAPWGIEADSVTRSKVESTNPDRKNPGSKGDDWRSVFEARSRHWCFQPIRRGQATRRATGLTAGLGTRSTRSSWRHSPNTGSGPHPRQVVAP